MNVGRDTTMRLLATDLDGTFIGDVAAMNKLWDDTERSGISLAFVTGRHLASVERFYANSHEARRAIACICMVGTEIYWWDDAGYRMDTEWTKHLADGWDRATAARLVETQAEVARQADEWQSALKASYYADDQPDVEQMTARLRDAGVEARMIYSGGRFLDVLPAKAGKGEALRYLATELGVDPGNVISAGDSGNDLDMMRADLGFRAIIVGNASGELDQIAAPHIYRAQSSHAAGIAEGLRHFGWL